MLPGMADLTLHLRSQRLTLDSTGHTIWEVLSTRKNIDAAKTALILCDVWDNHHSRGAVERLEAMIPRMNQVMTAARRKGVLIIHSPSDVIEFYKDHPARRRVTETPKVEPPANREHDDPPSPVDTSVQNSDTNEPFDRATFVPPWTREHPGIDIDSERDAISADGREVYSLFKARGIEQVLIMGVHTNMCILHRSFAIKQMVRWGVNIVLVRDLTDTMYNPSRSPYVSHDEGTRLVIGFIEKFWCPTILSDDLLA
jgi:nicotinamidase-related amidase